MTKRDRIVAELRRMIRDGELSRGSRIQQDVLADRFSTSITPVREALVLLEAEGLLVSSPNRGVSVADADFEQVKTAYIQRMLLEPYAMQRATRRISQRELDLAESILARIDSYAAPTELVGVSELNRQFHFLFYNNCGNEGLIQQIEQLWRRWPWDLLDVVEGRPQHASAEHRDMIDAVRHGDVAAVENVTREHLRKSFVALSLHLTGQVQEDPFLLDNN